MVFILKKGTTKESIEILLRKVGSKKGVNTHKYCGILKLKKDALLIQKELRDEWG